MVIPTESNQNLSPLRGDQQVLLCICNCQEILAIRKLVLEAFGYEVLAADDITAANALMEQPVDIAILDYRAQGASGELIVLRTKILQPLTPIVMLVDDPEAVPKSIVRLTRAVVKREYSPLGLLREIAHILREDSQPASRPLAARRIA